MSKFNECALCEFKGYSPQLCKMHLRHLVVTAKKKKAKARILASRFNKETTLIAIRREEQRKKLKDTGVQSAIGAGIGAGGGYAGAATLALVGGAVAAHIIAAPLMIGAAVIGGSVAALRSLKKEPVKPKASKSSFSKIYGFNPDL